MRNRNEFASRVMGVSHVTKCKMNESFMNMYTFCLREEDEKNTHLLLN